MYSDQHLRVSDAEREAVTGRLAEHFAAGRLDQAEVTQQSLSLSFNPFGCDLGVSRAFCQVVPACRGA